MPDQSLAQHRAEIQQQITNLRQHALRRYRQQSDVIGAIFAPIDRALDAVQQIEASIPTNGAAERLPLVVDIGVESIDQGTPCSAISHGSPLVQTMNPGEVQPQLPETRSENEQALQHQIHITQTITDNTTACLFMMDAQGRCTLMSPAAEEVTGHAFGEVEGKLLHDLIHHTRPDGRLYLKAECPIDRALPQNNRICAHEDVFVRKDGTFFPVVCAASPIIKDGIPVSTVIEVRDVTESKRAEQERARLLEAEQRAVRRAQHQAKQLRGLTAASIAINGALSLEEVLQVITEQARQVIGAHQAFSSLSVGNDWKQAIRAISLSDKYRASQSYHALPDGLGISAEICLTNRPMRLTQAELEAHPDWHGFGAHASEHPPLRGWLAAPFISCDGRNIGLIQLSDTYEGDFTADNEAVMVQLAQMASGALENARLYTAAQEAIRARNEFLSVASHELNTPATSLRGYAQLLSRQIKHGQTLNTERMVRALSPIEQQSITLGQPVNQPEGGTRFVVRLPLDR